MKLQSLYSFILVVLVHAFQFYIFSEISVLKEKPHKKKIVVMTKTLEPSIPRVSSPITHHTKTPHEVIQKALPIPKKKIEMPKKKSIKKPLPAKKKPEPKSKQVLKKIDQNLAAVTEKKKTKVPIIKEPIPHLIDETPDLYYTELCDLFQNALILPEKGIVKLTISVQANGKIAKISLVSSKSEKNLEYLLSRLPELVLPKSQDGKDVVFTITFSDE